MSTLTFELFDRFGKFVMPSAEVIASLDDGMRSRFEAVQSASSALDVAKSNREAAEQTVVDALAERDNAEAELRRVRPKISQTQLAKEWIASQRAQ